MKYLNLSLITLFGLASLMILATEAKQPNARNASKTGKKEQYAFSIPKPTLSEVSYGTHERHVLDFWKADSEKPTPLVFVIHGGGWKNGSKERLNRFVDAPALLKAGISVVAINYRYINKSNGLEPPVKAPCV